jgi:tetratricopeptide (TPR) repeat protein
MAMATSGRLSVRATGLIYCRCIRTWLDIFDFRRAAEWIEMVNSCAVVTGFAGNAGDCRAHLAAALVARGCWNEAEREALRACDECDTYEIAHVGIASHTLGDIHLRRGDLRRAEESFERAEESFERAVKFGVVPQPGLLLLQLAKGDAESALTALKAHLDSTASPAARAAVLPVAVELALASGDVGWAHSLTTELERVADAYGSPALTAAASRARGALALDERDAVRAVAALRTALDLFRTAEMPYEVGTTRVLLAAALTAAGDSTMARMELSAARELFERIGARSDVAKVDELVAKLI